MKIGAFVTSALIMIGVLIITLVIGEMLGLGNKKIVQHLENKVLISYTKNRITNDIVWICYNDVNKNVTVYDDGDMDFLYHKDVVNFFYQEKEVEVRAKFSVTWGNEVVSPNDTTGLYEVLLLQGKKYFYEYTALQKQIK